MSEKVNPELNSQSLDFSIRRSQFSYIIIKEPGQKKPKKLSGSLTGELLQTFWINLQLFLCWMRARIELKSVFLKYDGSSWRHCLYLKVRGHLVVKIWILT